MSKLSRELTTPVGGTANLHPRETLLASGTLGVLNAEVIMAADGVQSLFVDVRGGAFNLTFVIEGTVDGTNWVAIPFRPVAQASVLWTAAAAVTNAGQGVWAAAVAGWRAVRVRCSAFTSGAATVTMSGSTSPLDPMLLPSVSASAATITAATGVAATLTLAAPGVGLRHYLTFLEITRSPTVALTASATPTLVTTTNIPGVIAFTFGADAAGIGVDKVMREDFALPLAASAQNTATTIVCPAVTGVIWRVNAGFYVGP